MVVSVSNPSIGDRSVIISPRHNFTGDTAVTFRARVHSKSLDRLTKLDVHIQVCITVYLRVLVEKFSPEQNTTQTIRLID